jgi:hypothetical protein
MYTHVSKCKNNKTKGGKKTLKISTEHHESTLRPESVNV